MKIKMLFLLVLLTSITIFGQWKKPSNVTFSWFNSFLMDVVDSNRVLILVRPSNTTHNGFLLTEDRGKNWKQIDHPFTNGSYGFISISMLKNGSIWVAYDDKIYANTSNEPFSGKWELQYSDTNLTKFILYVKMFDTMKGIAMGECKDMYSPAIFLQTTDGGKHWIRTDKSKFIGGTLSTCDPVIKFFNENVGFVLLYKQTTPNSAGPDSLYKTTNGGKDWSAIKTALSPLGHVRIFTENKIVNWGKEISITTDDGANWKNYTTPLTTSCSDYWLDEKNSSNIWVLSSGTNRGLFFSNNGGLSFSIKGGSISSLRKMQVINNKVGFILGDNGDFYVTDDIQYYTTGLNEDSKSIPIEYSLEQNYPNPFNPSTKISYQIPQSSFVTLKIYDQLGREISKLVNQIQQAGKHSIHFTLRASFSSGVYFYTLKAGNFAETKKLILMK